MNYTYEIGDMTLSWNDLELHLKEDEFFRPFRVDSRCGKVSLCYTVKPITSVELNKSALLQKTDSSEIYATKNGQFIVFHWHNIRFAYGFYFEDFWKDGPISCYMSYEIYKKPPINTVRFFSTAGLHSKLLKNSAVVTHASYIITHWGAVLFTAPSGIGKSTQANLWMEYENAKIINGDRALIKKKSGKFHAYGYPCCGSSNICINHSAPICAIVSLAQSDRNEILIPSETEKIRILLSGIEVFHWLSCETERAVTVASQIAREIPIYKLYCTADQQAVSVLKNYLRGEKCV